MLEYNLKYKLVIYAYDKLGDSKSLGQPPLNYWFLLSQAMDCIIQGGKWLDLLWRLGSAANG